MPSGKTARLASGVRLRYEVTEPPEGTRRRGRVVVTPGGKQGVDGARTMARMMEFALWVDEFTLMKVNSCADHCSNMRSRNDGSGWGLLARL